MDSDEYRATLVSYHHIAQTPAMVDLLKTLTDLESTAVLEARKAVDNPVKASGLLQQSLSYDTIKLYIKRKLDEYDETT